jgi:hypothetical protein
MLKNDIIMKEEQFDKEKRRRVEIIRGSRCLKCGKLFSHTSYSVSSFTHSSFPLVINGILSSKVYSNSNNSLLNPSDSNSPLIIFDPLSVSPNNSTYHFSCYCEIEKDRRLNYHPTKTISGFRFENNLNTINNSLNSRNFNLDRENNIKTFFGLSSPLISPTVKYSTSSGAPLSLFSLHGIKNIDMPKGKILQSFPVLSNFFTSSNHTFSDLFSNNYIFPQTSIPFSNIIPYDINLSSDEIFLKNLPPTYNYVHPLTSFPSSFGLPSTFSSSHSELGVTEGSYLAEEREKMMYIMKSINLIDKKIGNVNSIDGNNINLFDESVGFDFNSNLNINNELIEFDAEGLFNIISLNSEFTDLNKEDHTIEVIKNTFDEDIILDDDGSWLIKSERNSNYKNEKDRKSVV